MSAYPDALSSGDVVGEIVVGDVIGQGGFGIVYEARHPEYGDIALKEFFPKAVASRSSSGRLVPSGPDRTAAFEKGVARLIEEGEKLRGLDHPGIVRVFDIVQDNGTAYLAMERVAGPTLQKLVDDKLARLDARFVRDFSEQLVSALKHIHDRDLIHRDIAPDNILCAQDEDGSWRFVLVDFGGAKRLVVDMSRTSTTTLVKTGYSPVEQYSREDGDGLKPGAWSDIYGASAVLYWLATGSPPEDSVARGAKDTLIPARKAAKPGFAKGFLDAVDWGLEVRADRRPQTVVRWRDALRGDRKRPKPGRWSRRIAAVLLFSMVSAGGAFAYFYLQNPDAVSARLNDWLPLDRARAEDRDYWAASGCTTSRAGCTAYLSRYPDGEFADNARNRIAAFDVAEVDAAFRSADTVVAWRAFLENFPNSKYETSALAALADAEADQDRNRWAATNTSRRSSLESYLDEYPNGLFSRRAREFLSDMESREEEERERAQAEASRAAAEARSRAVSVPAPQPVVREPVCRTVYDNEQVCNDVTRYRRECNDQRDEEYIDYSYSDRWYSPFVVSIYEAEQICEDQAESKLLRGLRNRCDGSVRDVDIYCSCSSSSQRCRAEADATCVTTREVCQNVPYTDRECQTQRVPRQVCE
ncbi:MAG: serine/threonine-protein kinase [Pseudomonadota bacterium]